MLNHRAASLPTGWSQHKIGAGGFLVGIDVAPDGTKVCRTDTYGAYLWDGYLWRQLVTKNSLPSYFPNWATGVFEIRIAPSNTQIFYMIYQGYCYRSANRGTTWSVTNLTRGNAYGNASPNDSSWRTHGAKLAINPSDPNHVITGFPGVAPQQTFDGGTTWDSLAGVTTADGATSGYRVLFISSSEILVLSAGVGVYRSTDTGTSWALTTSGPTDLHNWQVAPDGIVYAADGDTNNFWKFNSGAWTNPSIVPAGVGWHSIMPDPADATHILAMDWGGGMSRSTDRGANWTAGLYAPGTRTATGDIPWLAVTNETYMSAGNAFINAATGKIEFGEGVGWWTTDKPTTYPQTVTWQAQSRGIEQLVMNDICALPEGGATFGAWDRPWFKCINPGNYPGSHGPSYTNSIAMGWAVSECTHEPGTLVGISNWITEESGVSTDGGLTWTTFTTKPPDIIGSYLSGCIAASTKANIVWVLGNTGRPYYTLNGGVTWALSTIDTGATTGWTPSYVFKHHTICADPLISGKYYMHNYNSGSDYDGIYVSTDGGANFARVYNGLVDIFTEGHAKLKAVPGRSGYLVFCSGEQDDPETGSHPSSTALKRSTDSGVTWASVPNVLEPRCFGFGKASSPGGFPAVYLNGWVSGVYGVWRSDDFDQATPAWTQLGQYPLDSLDNIIGIAGDKATHGRCIVAFGGSGCAVYTP